MSEYSIKPGDPLFLSAKLEDEDTSKYVRCDIVSELGLSITGSPFAIPHTQSGLYIKYDPINILFPINSNYLTATYKIYDDPGFTTLSEKYEVITDVFYKSVVSDNQETLDAIEEKVDYVIDNMVTNIPFNPGVEIIGTVEDLSILADIEQIPELTGDIEDGIIDGIVEEDSLSAVIEEIDEIQGIIEDD